MSVAKKVSIRMDSQGVLSLQFMVEVEAAVAAGEAAKLSFVDFVVVPMIEEDGEEDGEEEGAEEAEGEDVNDETILMNGDGDGDEDMG